MHEGLLFSEDFLTLDIFARVVLPHLFRLRLVCRAWNALLSSQDFLHLWSQRHGVSGNTWLFVSPWRPHSPQLSSPLDDDVWCTQMPCSSHLRLYCGGGVWFPVKKCRFNVLPNERLGIFPDQDLALPLNAYPGRRWLAGSVSGPLIAELACYLDPLERVRRMRYPLLRVFNFLTGCRRRLPIPSPSNCAMSPMNSISYPDRESWFRDDSGSDGERLFEEDNTTKLERCHIATRYKLENVFCKYHADPPYYYVVLYCLMEGRFYVHDSRHPHSWMAVYGPSTLASPGSTDRMPEGNLTEGNVLQGDIFLPFFDEDRVFFYCLESDRWSFVVAPFPAECKPHGAVDSAFPKVFKCEGSRILLVMAVFGPCPNPSPYRTRFIQAFVVWELRRHTFTSSVDPGQSCSHFWEELSRSRQEFRERQRYFGAQYVATDTAICITSVTWGSVEVAPLVFDVTVCTWYHLPFPEGTNDLLVLIPYQTSFSGVVP